MELFDLDSKYLQLAPVYDVLPMLYVPVENQIVERVFEVSPPKSDAFEEWGRALILARLFWSLVSEDSRVSEYFRKISASI